MPTCAKCNEYPIRPTVVNTTHPASTNNCHCNVASSCSETTVLSHGSGRKQSQSVVPAIANKGNGIADQRLHVGAVGVRGRNCTVPSATTPCCTGVSQFCGETPALACGSTTLGKVAAFEGSVLTSVAIAGTPAANPYVIVRASDECGVIDWPGKEQEGDIIRFDEATGTYKFVRLQFENEVDSEAINGDGFDVPLTLDLDYIADNLLAVLGADRIAAAGYEASPP